MLENSRMSVGVIRIYWLQLEDWVCACLWVSAGVIQCVAAVFVLSWRWRGIWFLANWQTEMDEGQAEPRHVAEGWGGLREERGGREWAWYEDGLLVWRRERQRKDCSPPFLVLLHQQQHLKPKLLVLHQSQAEHSCVLLSSRVLFRKSSGVANFLSCRLLTFAL